MLGTSRFARIHQLFADQFEVDGAEFLYRKSMRGVPIRVTAAERDAFVSVFRRRLCYASWSIIPATVVLIGLLVLLLPNADSPSDFATYAGLAAILVPYLTACYWAWNAPARELERRPPAGARRTRQEIQQLTFAKMTYGQLGYAAVAAPLLVVNASAKHDVFHGWGVLWLAVAGALIVAVAVQAFRKWSRERH